MVDSGDRQVTARALREAGFDGRVRLIPSRSGLPRQRNVGLDHTTADIVFFFDDDMTVEPRYVECLMAHFAADPAGRLGGISGRLWDRNRLPGRGGQLVRRFFLLSRTGAVSRMQRSGFAVYPVACAGPPIEAEVLWAGGLAIRRSVYPEFRFDDTLEGYALMEDGDFTFRLSRRYRLVCDPAVTVVHHAASVGRAPLGDYCAMMVVNSHYLFRKNRRIGGYRKSAFLWANVGLWVFWGLLTGIRRRSLGPLRGLCRGYAMVRRGQLFPALPDVAAADLPVAQGEVHAA